MTNLSACPTTSKRVLVTGGAGDMGAYACRVLAKADEVEQVLIADRELGRAETLASELGPKAVAFALEISDADALGTALSNVDIVLNTAGPFYRFEREVLSAAIVSGTDYLDICDDWEPTLQMLELDDAARAAGVTAVIGMGASPGTSNLLAMLAMNQCDTVDRSTRPGAPARCLIPPRARSRRPTRLSSTGCTIAPSRSRSGAAASSSTPSPSRS